jgi:hypothetical protein
MRFDRGSRSQLLSGRGDKRAGARGRRDRCPGTQQFFFAAKVGLIEVVKGKGGYETVSPPFMLS